MSPGRRRPGDVGLVTHCGILVLYILRYEKKLYFRIELDITVDTQSFENIILPIHSYYI